jgi:hypothetical protein
MELQQAKSLTSDHTKFAEPAKVVPSIFKPAIPITQSVTPSEYSLTDSEKDEIKANYAARLIPAARELETLVQPPYSVFCDTRFPDCLFVLCNEEGDVIKEDPSPRVVKNYYERICLT